MGTRASLLSLPKSHQNDREGRREVQLWDRDGERERDPQWSVCLSCQVEEPGRGWRWAPAGRRCCLLGEGPASSRGAENWPKGRCPAPPHALPLSQARDPADSGGGRRTPDFSLGERQWWALRDSGPGRPRWGRRGQGHRGRVSGLLDRPGPVEGTSAALRLSWCRWRAAPMP